MSGEDELERKLIELEASIADEERKQALAKPKIVTSLQANQDDVKADLYLISGCALLLTGIFLVFNHVQVGTSMLAWLGFGPHGFGLTLIPFLIGMAIIFYDYKKRVGWVLTAASCALIFFAVLSQLIMTFPTTSLLGLVIMFLPLAAGIALILKGAGKRRS